ncbi:MAG: ABC transporter ATP-binding protein, partial [Clostridiales bacterium]
KIVDFFTQWKSGESLDMFYLYAVAICVTLGVASFFRLSVKYVLAKISNKVHYNMRVIGFQKIIGLSLDNEKKESTGEKAQKIQNGTEAFSQFTMMLQNNIYNVIAGSIGVLIIFIFLQAKYLLFFISYIGISLLILKIFSKKLEELNIERNKLQELASGSFVDGLTKVQTIKSSGTERNFQDRLNDKEEIKRVFEDKIQKTYVNMWKIFQVANSISIFVFLVFIGNDVVNGVITVGAIVTFFGYYESLRVRTSGFMQMYSNIIRCKTLFGSMMRIYWGNKEKEKGKECFPNNWRQIIFKDSSFKYKEISKEKDMMFGVENINLKINKHSKIGLAGQSGSGKSTLTKLMIGLYDLDSGNYTIDNTELKKIKHDEIFKNIALVLQETEIFNLSFKENITLMRSYSKDEFDNVIKIAELEDVLKKLPKGVDTPLGENGYSLSGGEKQRIGIARAIYSNCEILIFDEATSSLDGKTEAKIQYSLVNKLENKTLIFIAHRLSTLKSLDKIYVFNKGRIHEEGNYDELLNNKESIFYQLYCAQDIKKSV